LVTSRERLSERAQRPSIRGAPGPRAIIAAIVTEPALATRTKRVLTGYRPTGALHVGHWAGNIENMLALQADDAYECFFFIADWHMLTTHYDRTDELGGSSRTSPSIGSPRARPSAR
jgi:hypothetical protein